MSAPLPDDEEQHRDLNDAQDRGAAASNCRQAGEVTVLDVHTHLAPSLFAGSVDDDLRSDGEVWVIDGHRVGPPRLYQPESLASWLTESGIDRAWVSPPPPFYRQGLGPATADWVTVLNDGLRAAIDGRTALDQLVYLPLDEPESALREIQRWALDDIAGWTAAAGGGSLPFDDPRLGPVWSAVEASDRPVLLHPGSSPDSRLNRYYLSNLSGNPIETTVAAGELVFGDVLGRHRDLRVVLAHCGGAVAALAGRWQHGFDTARPGVESLTVPPAEAVRRFWVDALGHSDELLDAALRVFGADRVVLGSDWPFPMGFDDPLAALAHLPAAIRRGIAAENVTTLEGGPR